MQHYSYYTVDPAQADRCITDKPLVVNCVGSVSLSQNFANNQSNGRRDFYIMYMINGEMDLYFGGAYAHLTQGQFIILPPNTPYRYNNKNDSCVDYYWVHFTGSDARKIIDDAGLPLCKSLDISIHDSIIRAFHRLFDEFIQPDELFEQSCHALFTTLCVRFARAAHGTLFLNAKNRVLAQTLQYMNRHYQEPLTIPELAKQANISCGYFRVLFRETTGSTPSEYLTQLKLKNACMLLYQTNLSIKEIASQVGFSDQLYFSRVFRKQYGIPPQLFRKQNCE